MKKLKKKVAYVKQSDLFFGHLTVRDQLTYTAFLRLPSSWPKVKKVAEVDRIIKQLRLNKCSDTPIHQISGGEKKRVNIGSELLTDPAIILLDEPTSGLDSTSAVALMSILHTLARDEGKTISKLLYVFVYYLIHDLCATLISYDHSFKQLQLQVFISLLRLYFEALIS